MSFTLNIQNGFNTSLEDGNAKPAMSYPFYPWT